MVLYSSFAGPALLLTFIIARAVIQQHISPVREHAFTVGIFSVIAILSDPLSVYAIAIVFAFLYLKNIRWGLRVTWITGGGLFIF